MSHFTPLSAALGGALIGLGAAVLLLVHGRIAGISGVFGDALRPSQLRGEGAYRGAFLAGLFAAGLLLRVVWPARLPAGTSTLLPLAVAGLLVGYGTRLGDGCTSGHGVCGLGRLSPRSLVATLTFMVTGAATVFVVRHLAGGGP